MKLVNETSFPAHLFAGPLGEAELGCAVLVKATYEIGPGGALEPATDGVWPVHLAPLPTPYGTFPGEVANRKPRTDLIVLGKARAPGGVAVRSMTVSVRVGTFRHELSVTGDRWWRNGLLAARASEPVPFLEMPIVWENAYGGKVATPVGDFPCADNPAGKGFLLDAKRADGVPLPNVEDPAAPVRRPLDAPRPAGWGPYPLEGGLRATGMLAAPGVLKPQEEVEPLVMNWAHPDLMIDAPAPGTPVEVEGLARGGPLATAVPALPVRLTLEAGEERRALSARLDTLVVQAEERRLVVRWRAAARFAMRPREARLVRVSPSAGRG